MILVYRKSAPWFAWGFVSLLACCIPCMLCACLLCLALPCVVLRCVCMLLVPLPYRVLYMPFGCSCVIHLLHYFLIDWMNCKRCALPASAQPSAQRLWFDCKQQSWHGQILASLDQLMSLARKNSFGKGKAMRRTRSGSWSQQTGRAGLGLARVGWWRAWAGRG